MNLPPTCEVDKKFTDGIYGYEYRLYHCQPIKDIESMATSNSSYLTRWAAVSRIAPIGETIDDGIVQWAEALRHDDCELIRLEAEL